MAEVARRREELLSALGQAEKEGQAGAERPYLMLTIPFVVYGLLRYLYLMHVRELGHSPEEVLLSDVPLIIDLGLWTAVVIAVLYLT